MHLLRAVKLTYLSGETGPSISDYQNFKHRVIKNDPSPFTFSKSSHQTNLGQKELSDVESWETTALFIVKADSIIYENYWLGYADTTKSNSFSVAKSLINVAIGAAIKKGCIKSLDDKIKEYLPELSGSKKGDVSIKDLLSMCSGIEFGESYGNPFGFMAKAYYGKELYHLTLDHSLKYEPGKVWKYQGGNSLLLSFVLKNACGKSLSAFFEDNIWSKIGAEEHAFWTISEQDSNERAYCCFYSNAKDFAKIGRLYLNSGNWNGKQLIDSSFVKVSCEAVHVPNEKGEDIDYYGLHWWLGTYKSEDFFYARGILGQYIVVFPKQQMILVRLGHKRDKTKGVKIPKDLYVYLEIASKAFD